jgi:hypothetical protein
MSSGSRLSKAQFLRNGHEVLKSAELQWSLLIYAGGAQKYTQYGTWISSRNH